MLGWFISLALVVLFTIGSWIPGAIDGTLTHALQERLGSTATATVHVEGDPLLQLPFGRIPLLEATLTGYRVMDVPVKQVTLRLTDVHVNPAEAFVAHRATLQAPAGAWLAIDVDAAALQGYVDRLTAQGAFSRLNGQVTIFGQRLGGTLNLLHPTLSLEGGRLGLAAEAEVQETGARLPVEASAGLAIESGRMLVLTEPQVLLNGRALPSFLVAPQLARFNPILDLEKLNLPPGRWGILGLDVTPAGLTLKVGGQLTALPAQ
jgi:hypothetical protein